MTGPERPATTERPGVAAVLDAWQAASGNVEPVVARYMRGVALGGALDAVAGYPLAGHWLLTTLGLTELDDKESSYAGISGYGFEFTLRIPRTSDATGFPDWPRRLLADLAARMRGGADFGPGDWLVTPAPLGGVPGNAPLTGLAIAYDPVLRRISTPNGSVDFLTVVGLTTAEGAAAQQAGDVLRIVEELSVIDPLLVTDPGRRSVR
jgi:hypothetical protein